MGGKTVTQSIQIQKWMRASCGWILCEALDWDHPMHPYKQALAQGVDPTAFGIANPLEEQFADYSRDDLIREIITLRKYV